VAVGLAGLVAVPAVAAEKPLRFDRDIRPILSEHCYACHGPAKQEAGLRLDDGAAATAPLASGAVAVVPGQPAASTLVARIRATDPDVVMPPPHTKKPLGAAAQELLERWIATGAGFEPHWSFRPLSRPEVPAAPAEITNPVDRFLEARLAAEGLPVNPAADRPTLARRLSFALTGLPPDPAEVAAFAADPAADAVERFVDRLVASPHHGEEMARHWLDVARYADTHGLHLDNERQMWAYRDWVVGAFNQNMPFDTFTIWQLAGDLLPGATRDQQTATGFSRCNVTTSEGGSINEELLFRYAVDRTATVVQAWMGITAQCAVCHDHKFDPLSQREFYSLYAFFNSAADPGFDGNILTTAPTITLPSAAEERELADLDARLPGLQQALDGALDAVVYTDPAPVDPRPEPVRTETVWLDDEFPPGAAVQSGGGALAWFSGGAPGEVLSGQRSLERTATGIGQDFYQSGAEPIVIPAGGEIFASVWIDPARPPRSVMLQFHAGEWKHRAVWGDIDAIAWGEAGKPSRFHAGPLPEPGGWRRLSVTVEQLGLAAGTKLEGFALTQFDGHVRWDLVGIASVSDPARDPTRSLAAWWQERTGKDKLDDVPGELRGLVKQGADKTTDAAEQARVRRHWLSRVWGERPEPLAKAVDDLLAARGRREALDKGLTRTFVFNDLPQMRDSFVMQRGAYDKPGAKVERATPGFLPPLLVATGDVPNRLDLAQWILSPRQPLTARVAANRLWQQFFGTGLVKTSEDFGLQGEAPSHPELLDWLACEYRDCGWDTRRMVRLLVTSRAFLRSAVVAPEQLAADPDNRLLARGPRLRLDAEQIRDNALAVAGLLVRTPGGRGVRPYQPDNIWEPVGFAGSNTQKYTRDSGTALYRRSLYTFLKRTAPPPFMVNFDAPNREQFCARRERSNTPLQALQLLNDVQHVEAARALAARALSEGGSDDAARIAWLFRTVLARPPEGDEAAVVTATLAAHRARYAADTEAARKLVSQGESKPPEGMPVEDLAPFTLVANLLLNLDETLTRN
jgi:hypothetical protein